MIALLSAPVFADEVYLKGGGQISGEIVEQSDTSITVDIGGGTLAVKTSQVVRVEKSVSPLQEYKQKAAAIASGDAAAWRTLARWAEGQALATQAREAWTQALRIQPDDPEANQALGRVQLDGAWVSEEDAYRAQGYVEFEHEWVTPGERDAILADRQAEAQAHQDAMQAQAEAEEAARQERQAQEQAESDAFWPELPQFGDEVLYTGYTGWGSPTYWPAPGQPVYGQRPQRPQRPMAPPARVQPGRPR